MSGRIRPLLEHYFALHTDFPIGPRQVQRIVKEVANRAQLTEEVTPHVLRHTFATLSLQKGISACRGQEDPGSRPLSDDRNLPELDRQPPPRGVRRKMVTEPAPQQVQLVEVNQCRPEDWLAVLDDPLWLEYRIGPHPFSLGAATAFHLRKLEGWGKTTEFLYGAFHESACVGVVSLHSIDWRHRCAQIFYWFARDQRRRGYARESVILLLKKAFDEHRLNRVEAQLRSDNLPSKRVLESLQFRFEAELPSKFINNDRPYDGLQYALLAEVYHSTWPYRRPDSR